MSDAFDPYYEWLGIPPREQPVNYYRLLALNLYETNLQVIANAADRQMAYIRMFQNGDHAKESQIILNEIARARVTLLNETSKREYDNNLKRQAFRGELRSAAPPVPTAPPVFPANGIAPVRTAPPSVFPANGIAPVRVTPPVSPANGIAPVRVAPPVSPANGIAPVRVTPPVSPANGIAPVLPKAAGSSNSTVQILDAAFETERLHRKTGNQRNDPAKKAKRSLILMASIVGSCFLVLLTIFILANRFSWSSSTPTAPSAREGELADTSQETTQTIEEPSAREGELADTNQETSQTIEEPSNVAGDRMVKTVNGVEFAFRWCPPGTFVMGGERDEWSGNSMIGNSDSHEVTLTKGFWLLETEVTVGMFKAFLSDTGYESQGDALIGWTGSGWKQDSKYSWQNPGFIQNDNHPVCGVSWNDAQAFNEWLGEQTGMSCSLPTEAQWEYACRAGTTEAYAGSLDSMAWYGKNSGNNTHPVGQKQSNAWGLFDMHGNAWEWCLDRYGAYPSGSVTDPIGASGSRRAARGGSWANVTGRCRSASRGSETPKYRSGRLGFRPVLVSSVVIDRSEKNQQENERLAREKEEAAKAKQESLRRAGERTVKAVNGVEFAFRWCPPGTFTMGSPESEEGREPSWSGKETQHIVTLTQGFWMQETEVTQAQWKAVMGNNPSTFKGDDLPVEKVSWVDCQEFCRKCMDVGLAAQLPTDAQWEYACRAGSTTRFSFGDSIDFLYNYCNYCDKSNTSGFDYQDKDHDDGYDKTAPVKSFQPNAWGLYDMHGNVWEWCNDWYIKDLTGNSVTDPEGPESGSDRVDRGGSWRTDPPHCRSARRNGFKPEDRVFNLGFRLSLRQ